MGGTSCKDATVCDNSRKQATRGENIFVRNCLKRIEGKGGKAETEVKIKMI